MPDAAYGKTRIFGRHAPVLLVRFLKDGRRSFLVRAFVVLNFITPLHLSLVSSHLFHDTYQNPGSIFHAIHSRALGLATFRYGPCLSQTPG